MFGQPFSLNDLQNQYLQLQQSPILEEINKEVLSLSKEEQTFLAQSNEYQSAKQIYENGFMTYLGNKFGGEYAASQNGKVAAENLLATIRKNKTTIQAQIKAKEERVNKLLELLETDPEMKKRMDEVLMKHDG